MENTTRDLLIQFINLSSEIDEKQTQLKLLKKQAEALAEAIHESGGLPDQTVIAVTHDRAIVIDDRPQVFTWPSLGLVVERYCELARLTP